MLMPHLRQFGKPMTAHTLSVDSSLSRMVKRLRGFAGMQDSSLRITGTSLRLRLEAILSVAPGILKNRGAP